MVEGPSHGCLFQDGFNQPLKVSFCVGGVTDEQSLTYRGLKSGDEKPYLKDRFMGVGYQTLGLGCGGSHTDTRYLILKISVHILKKPNTSNWFFTPQYCCPKGREIYLNVVRCFCIAFRCIQLWACSVFWLKPLEFMFSKVFLYQ